MFQIISHTAFYLEKPQIMPLSDSQIFIALFIALLTGILAVRLGLELYGTSSSSASPQIESVHNLAGCHLTDLAPLASLASGASGASERDARDARPGARWPNRSAIRRTRPAERHLWPVRPWDRDSTYTLGQGRAAIEPLPKCRHVACSPPSSLP